MPTITDSDSGHWAESDPSTIIIRSFPLSNCGDWTTSPGTATQVTDSDSGHWADAVQGVSPVSADSGTWTDANGSPKVLDSDVGVWSDQSSFTVTSADSGTWADAGEQAGHAITGSETGSWLEASTVTVRDGDTGHWVDGRTSATRTVRDQDNGTWSDSDGTITKTGTGVAVHRVEQFSISRASILSRAGGGTLLTDEAAGILLDEAGNSLADEAYQGSGASGAGTEAAQLTGVRSGQVELQFTEIANVADDIQIAMWIELSAADVTVIGGYLPFSAVALLLNSPVSGPDGSNRYAMPIAVQQMLAGAEVPMVLSGTARSADGIPEALQVVLYRVRIGRVDTATAGYKNGLAVSFAGTALLSQQDEAGNALPPDSGGQSRREIGRLVSSPDASGQQAIAGIPAPVLQPAYGVRT